MRPKDTKSRAQRIKVDYHKRRGSLRFSTSLLSWLLPCLVIAWVSYSFGIEGHEQMFSSGQVSSRHASFANNCNQCHSEAFAKIPDQTCLNCHDSPEHHANMQHQMSCVDCHKEHGTVQELTTVSDQHCAVCHEDLQLKKDDQLVAVTHFDSNIQVFKAETEERPEGHRGIQLMSRYSDAKALLNELKNPKAKITNDAKFEATLKAGLDVNRLNLNHQKHMTFAKVNRDWRTPRFSIKDGANVVHGRARSGDRGFAIAVNAETAPFLKHDQAENPWYFFQDQKQSGYVRKSSLNEIHEATKKRDISCSVCHEPVSAGDYYAAPNFERHCADCHAVPGNAGLIDYVPDASLTLATGKAVTLKSMFQSDAKLLRQLSETGEKVIVTVPHENFLTIRGYLRDALERYVAQSNGEFKVKAKVKKKVKRRYRYVSVNVEMTSAQFIEQNLAAIESSIYKSSCQKCHENKSRPFEPFAVNRVQIDRAFEFEVAGVSKKPKIQFRAIGDITIAPPETPVRWYQHASFDHESHKSTNCVSCHAHAGGNSALPDLDGLSKDSLVADYTGLLTDAKSGFVPEAELRLKAVLAALQLVTAETQSQTLDSDLIKSAIAKFEEMLAKPEALLRRVVDMKFANTSTDTHDVLLPNLSSCMTCHNPDNGAGSSCVECHIYHDRSKEKTLEGFKSIDEMQNIMSVGCDRPGGFTRIVEYVKGLSQKTGEAQTGESNTGLDKAEQDKAKKKVNSESANKTGDKAADEKQKPDPKAETKTQ